MRVLLILSSLTFGLSAFAGTWDDCGLSPNGMIYQDTVVYAKVAAQHNLLDELDQTPLERVRAQLPPLLQKNPKAVAAFQNVTLNSKEPHYGRMAVLETLKRQISACFFQKVRQELGSAGNANELEETESGRRLVRELQAYVQDLQGKSVTEDEKKACYKFAPEDDRRAGCWQGVAYKVLETVLVPMVLKNSLQTLRDKNLHKKGIYRVDHIEDVVAQASSRRMENYHKNEVRVLAAAKEEEDLLHKAHK